MKHMGYICLAVSGAIMLSACQTVSLPKMDLIKLPEFRKEIENLAKLPEVKDAPPEPTEVKSADDWDNRAKQVIAKGENFNPPQDYSDYKTEEQISTEIEELKSKVDAYKSDDPVDLKWGED